MTESAFIPQLEHFLQGGWTGSKRVQGIQGGARAFVLALAANRLQRPMLVVCAGASAAENFYHDLDFFLG